jgi:hypothetical protein
MIYMFTKESCGPCGLVKRYINALKDDRKDQITEVYLEDLVVTDENGELLETYTGGLPITQNIRKVYNKYIPNE